MRMQLLTVQCKLKIHTDPGQARRVDSVEGGSFICWELFFYGRH